MKCQLVFKQSNTILKLYSTTWRPQGNHATFFSEQKKQILLKSNSEWGFALIVINSVRQWRLKFELIVKNGKRYA